MLLCVTVQQHLIGLKYGGPGDAGLVNIPSRGGKHIEALKGWVREKSSHLPNTSAPRSVHICFHCKVVLWIGLCTVNKKKVTLDTGLWDSASSVVAICLEGHDANRYVS